jgi:hypothetical protein
VSRVLRTLLAVAAAVGATAALAALSRLPYTPEPGPEALLRLSWRARGERVEICRELSPEEQQELPQHMRQTRTCEGTTAEYRLRVELDGRRRMDAPVQGSGEVQVRPLYVYRELALAPGEHRLTVTFERVGPAERDAEAEAEDSEEEEEDGEEEEVEDGEASRGRRAREAAVPRRLALERVVRLRPREVLLVTYDADRRELVVRP